RADHLIGVLAASSQKPSRFIMSAVVPSHPSGLSDRARPGISVGDTQAGLAYLGDFLGRPVHYAMPPPDGGAWEQAHYHLVTVPVRDARAFGVPPELDTEGFTLVQNDIGAFDFTDRALVKAI